MEKPWQKSSKLLWELTVCFCFCASSLSFSISGVSNVAGLSSLERPVLNRSRSLCIWFVSFLSEASIYNKFITCFHESWINEIWIFPWNLICLKKNFHLEIKIKMPTYLRGISGQWDILLLNLTSIGFTIFFRCIIFEFFFLNADVVTIKDETSKENS